MKKLALDSPDHVMKYTKFINLLLYIRLIFTTNEVFNIIYTVIATNYNFYNTYAHKLFFVYNWLQNRHRSVGYNLQEV